MMQLTSGLQDRTILDLFAQASAPLPWPVTTAGRYQLRHARRQKQEVHVYDFPG